MHTIILSSAVVLAVMISLMSVSRVDSACGTGAGAGNIATLTATGIVQTGEKQAQANRPYLATDPCTWTLTPQNKEILVRFTQGNLREPGTNVALTNFKGGAGAAAGVTIAGATAGTSLVDLSFVASSTAATTIKFTSDATVTLGTRREVKFEYFLGCGESITLPTTGAGSTLTLVHPKKGDNKGLLESNCVVTIKTTAPQYASITRTPTYGYAGNQACAATEFGMTLTGVKSESGTKLCKTANMASTTTTTSGSAGQDVVITFNSGSGTKNVNTAKIVIASSNYCIEKNTLTASSTVQSVAMSTAATFTPTDVATCIYEIVSDKLAVVNMQAFNGGTSGTALQVGGFGNADTLARVTTPTLTASTLFVYGTANSRSTISYTYTGGTAVATPMKFSLIKLCDQTIALPAAGITFASPKALNTGAFVNDLKVVATCKVTFTSANGFSSTITNAVFPAQTTCTENYFQYTLQGKTAEAQICDATTLSTAKTLTTGSSLTFAFAASKATRFNVKISPTTRSTTKSVNAMQFNLAALLISLAAVLMLKF